MNERGQRTVAPTEILAVAVAPPLPLTSFHPLTFSLTSSRHHVTAHRKGCAALQARHGGRRASQEEAAGYSRWATARCSPAKGIVIGRHVASSSSFLYRIILQAASYSQLCTCHSFKLDRTGSAAHFCYSRSIWCPCLQGASAQATQLDFDNVSYHGRRLNGEASPDAYSNTLSRR